MQKSIDNNLKGLRRTQFMRALKNAVKQEDLTQYQADKLRRGYVE